MQIVDLRIRNFKSIREVYIEGIENAQNIEFFVSMKIEKEGKIRYGDGYQKHNSHILELFPKVYYIDAGRRLDCLQGDILMLQEDELLKQMRSGCCMFDRAKKCNHCFPFWRRVKRNGNGMQTLLLWKIRRLW